MKCIFEEMDVGKTGEVDWTQFEKYITNEGTGHFLRSHGIVTHDAQQLFLLLDEMDENPSGTMDLLSFVLGMQRISGTASGTDLVLLLVETRKHTKLLLSELEEIKHMLVSLSINQSIHEYVASTTL